MNNAYLITDGTLTVSLDGKSSTISRSDPVSNRIIDALKENNWGLVKNLMDKPASIVSYTSGKVKVKNGQVYYKNRPLHNYLTNKILKFIDDDLPVLPLLRFMNNLMLNPNKESIEQLYEYCERYSLPISESGHFYAWKAVDKDLKDKYTHTISYKPGKRVRVKRPKCVTDRDVACAYSLHAGATQYVRQYGSDETDRFIQVRINPRHVVSCPNDSSWQKLRCCEIYSVKEVKREEVMDFNKEYIL